MNEAYRIAHHDATRGGCLIFDRNTLPELRWLFDAIRDHYELFARDIAPLNLDESLPGKPVTSVWTPYTEERFATAQLQGKYLLGLASLYRKTGDKKWLGRMEELVEFCLWSQYDADGRNRFVPAANPLWAFGWPDHSFEWKSGTRLDGAKHISKKYEPHHHENCVVVFGLINTFELTDRRDCLDACIRWAENQTDKRYGSFTGEWRGMKYLWQSYPPLDQGVVPEAVCNVMGLVGLALAQIGYHAGNETWLKQAEQMMVYLCKEQQDDGSWNYLGSEFIADPRLGQDNHDRRYKAHYQWGQLCHMAEVVEYLKHAGRHPPECMTESLHKGSGYLKKAGFTAFASIEKPGRGLDKQYTLPEHIARIYETHPHPRTFQKE